MKVGIWTIVVAIAVIGLCSFIGLRKPIIAGKLTRQTVYLWALNSFHLQSADAQPIAMLMDDDSGEGIFAIKRITNHLGIKATFAVIPSRLSREMAESLKIWQQEGYGIALHGYNHDSWKDWSSDKIISDISASEKRLEALGLQTDFKYVVPPYACNTAAIRKAVRQKGYKYVTGANIVNPDTTMFQYGRIWIGADNGNIEEQEMRELLTKAYEKRSFVIFGTHSSMPGAFSESQATAVLQMALDIGFRFI